MLKSFKYRLYPNVPQAVLMEKHFGCVRLVYNSALERKMAAYKYDKTSLSRYDLQKELKESKHDESLSFLKEVNSQSLQYALLCLDNAYKNFFKHEKGYPNFKSKSNRNTFHCPQNVEIVDGKLYIPKFKTGIEVRQHRAFKGEIRSCTVIREPSGKYFVSVLVETKVEKPVKVPVSDNAVGVDLGLKSFIVLSDGTAVNNPKYLSKSLDKLKYHQRILARKKKGSNRRNRYRIKVARIHEKISNQREDFLHKLSSEITNRFDTICMESLKIQNMVKNRKLSRAISDVGWGAFTRMVEYKCEWKGKNLLKVDSFCPSTKTCSHCKHVNNGLTLADRNWICPQCGAEHDRDINAAVNIKEVALNNWRTERACQDAEVNPMPLRKRKGKNAVEASNLNMKTVPLPALRLVFGCRLAC